MDTAWPWAPLRGPHPQAQVWVWTTQAMECKGPLPERCEQETRVLEQIDRVSSKFPHSLVYVFGQVTSLLCVFILTCERGIIIAPTL